MTRALRYGVRCLQTVAALILGSLAASDVGLAQTATFMPCTPGVLQNCGAVQITATNLGGGGTQLDIAVANLGSTTQPLLATSVYNLVFGTGSVALATPVSLLQPPTPVGGALLTDASPWELVDAGDALFLSALSDRGVGGCTTGGDVDGFGQAGSTCGVGQFLTFSLLLSRAVDVTAFDLLNFEVVGLGATATGDSCGGPVACVGNVVPEPTPVWLLGGVLTLLGVVQVGARWRGGRRLTRSRPALGGPADDGRITGGFA